MTLEEAKKAVEELSCKKKGRFFNWEDWSRVEETLRCSGYINLADIAHFEMMRAYHKEEYDSDLL